jgi:predicted DNA-binding transcriptional regulator YafY
MPSNKNALIRYKYLDELLSDRHHYYDIHDLTEMCNERLYEDGFPEVTQRCIEKDIVFMQEAPFNADIERFRKGTRNCIRYADASFSIFNKELTDEECNLIREVLNTIGQFDGLANFEWLESMKVGLGLKERPKIISFSNNPKLQNSNLLGVLFDHISNKVVIKLEYHRFTDNNRKEFIIHPYLLKQYNERWYLIGASDADDQMLTFAMDRIDKVTPLPGMKFRKCKEDLTKRFKDVIGVTLYKNRDKEHILFWVSEQAKEYMKTKPIHESQICYTNEKEQELRQRFPRMTGGAFFSIDCIPNYELTRELTSFGKELIVLSPESIMKQVFARAAQICEAYATLL